MRTKNALKLMHSAFRQSQLLLAREWSSPIRPPLRTRLSMWSRGFLSESAAIYELGRNSASGYLPDYPQFVRAVRINRPYNELLNDKILFHQLSSGTVPIPRHFGCIFAGRYIPLDSVGADLVDREDVLVELCRRYGGLVIKPRGGACGRGVTILHHNEQTGAFTLNGVTVYAGEIVPARFAASDMIVTEFVRQAAYAERIYANTTNTIRFLTLIDPDVGQAFGAIAVHRFGNSRSAPVDNWTQGGFSARIDLDTGTLGPAIAYPLDSVIRRVDAHPETGEPIRGVCVPHWPEIRDAVLRAAQRLAFIPYIGWDIVVTDEAFAVIEANNRSDVNLLQVHHPLLTDERVARFYRHHKVLRGALRDGPRYLATGSHAPTLPNTA